MLLTEAEQKRKIDDFLDRKFREFGIDDEELHPARFTRISSEIS